MNNRAAQLAGLKAFFDSCKLPNEVQLNQAVRIIDVPKFIESHMTAAALDDPRGVHEIFLTRLQQLKEILENSPADSDNS